MADGKFKYYSINSSSGKYTCLVPIPNRLRKTVNRKPFVTNIDDEDTAKFCVDYVFKSVGIRPVGFSSIHDPENHLPAEILAEIDRNLVEIKKAFEFDFANHYEFTPSWREGVLKGKEWAPTHAKVLEKVKSAILYMNDPDDLLSHFGEDCRVVFEKFVSGIKGTGWKRTFKKVAFLNGFYAGAVEGAANHV